MTTLQQAPASPHLQEAHKYELAFLERARSGEDIRDDLVLYLQRPFIPSHGAYIGAITAARECDRSL